MKNQTLKQIIEQIKKYELADAFDSEKDFKSWVSKLNKTQINNFLGLNIQLKEVENIKGILVNSNLLNCEDYNKRVNAISTLKNGEGCWHLYDKLCKPNFLKSKNFYKDIEMLSKADTATYGLWVIAEDSFINSPYHDEDLKLIIEAKLTNEEGTCSFLIPEALATVAKNKDSIKSPYHRADMKLIATSGSDCLQMNHSYPEHSLNNLAVNKESLKDKYHLENMKILANNPISSIFLYEIMTTPEYIKGINYREEVNAILNAKSKAKARALYYYIVNPKNKFNSDPDYYKDIKYDSIIDAYIVDVNFVQGSNDPEYLDNLKLLNEVDDEVVMYFTSLLMNPNFINSKYKKFDLDLLKDIRDRKLFMSLYRLMSDDDSLKNKYHENDAIMLSQAKSGNKISLLLEVATSKYSLESKNHDYDMKYISQLDIDSINNDIFVEMRYYLCNLSGMKDERHVEKLEKLAKGQMVERKSKMVNYLDSLEEQIKNSNEEEIIKSVSPVIQKKRFSRFF